MKGELWVVPVNDGESVEVEKMVRASGRRLLVSHKSWGVRWNDLEPEILDEIRLFQPDQAGRVVYGVEIGGDPPFGCVAMDVKEGITTIEQVALALGVELTLYQQAVGWNDAGYIPLMRANGVSSALVDVVRWADRCAQGVTPDHEAEAVRAIQAAETLGRLTVVRMSHSRTSTVCDRLFGHYDQLLILSGDGEVNLYGDGALCVILRDKFGGWNGGAGLGEAGEEAFWGGYPDHDAVLAFVSEWLA